MNNENKNTQSSKLVTLWVRVPLLIFALFCVNVLNAFWEPLRKSIAHALCGGSPGLYGLINGIFAALFWGFFIAIIVKICKLKKSGSQDNDR